jgi:hypothetical protein
MKRLLPAILFAVAMAACGEQSPPVVPPVPMPEPEPATEPTPPPAPSGGYAAVPAPGEDLPRSQTTPGPIPLEYRHVWAIDAEDCTASPSLTRIAIAPGAIRFYEGRSVVKTADVSTDGALTLKVDHLSEGTTSEETHLLRLSAEDRALSYQRGGHTFAYTRCE